tara:strand:- start:696 stop:1688 length:993 start_codon:yes stop_codon:yes gene_type:complete
MGKNRSLISRIHYWNRIFKAYYFSRASQLTFWHGRPEANEISDLDKPIPYYMKFHYKANYNGHFNDSGIPLLDYHGKIGLQYNPIAICQYGLGNYNLYLDTKNNNYKNKFLNISNWLVENLEKNDKGVYVWHHYFDFEYRDTLISPWYSGLAQGLGLSMLSRAYYETKEEIFLEILWKSWESMKINVDDGGVIFIDENNNFWIEEYMVNPPTHILNGFIWALWGVYDVWKFFDYIEAKDLFQRCCKTIEKNLNLYDTGYWSLYEQSGLKSQMISSPFYHDLHIVQLRILYNLTKNKKFLNKSNLWYDYKLSNFNRIRSFVEKSIFKLRYY